MRRSRGGGGEYVQKHCILSSLEISDRIHDLYDLHTHLFNLTSAQEQYSLLTAGSSDKDFHTITLTVGTELGGGIGIRTETETVL